MLEIDVDTVCSRSRGCFSSHGARQSLEHPCQRRADLLRAHEAGKQCLGRGCSFEATRSIEPRTGPWVLFTESH